jgi:nucleosome binding factor SPN SPT16 subunit
LNFISYCIGWNFLNPESSDEDDDEEKQVESDYEPDEDEDDYASDDSEEEGVESDEDSYEEEDVSEGEDWEAAEERARAGLFVVHLYFLISRIRGQAKNCKQESSWRGSVR